LEGFAAGVVVASIFAGVLSNEGSEDAKFSESIAVMKLFGFGIKATCLHEAGDSLESGNVAFVVDDVREEKERRVQSPFVNEQGNSQYGLRFRPHLLESVKESLVICEQRLISRLGFTQEECNAFFNAYGVTAPFRRFFAIRVGGVPVDTHAGGRNWQRRGDASSSVSGRRTVGVSGGDRVVRPHVGGCALSNAGFCPKKKIEKIS
jgi:hypothetical protein